MPAFGIAILLRLGSEAGASVYLGAFALWLLLNCLAMRVVLRLQLAASVSVAVLLTLLAMIVPVPALAGIPFQGWR